MKMSNALIPTLRDNPADADTVSAQLLLRAGFIRKSAAGLYHYLPLGKRVLQKIETIVREEMDAFGGQELLMPIVQPAELWLQTGRWHAYGPEMFKVTDRHERQFCLGPTHEELITDLVHSEVNSYRQLPLRLYQIQNKYRDEKRPRFGLIRSREFIMKDLYSFDRDPEGLDKAYWDMYQAYTNVFNRCGLKFRPIEADGGAIGDSQTHEFTALAEIGENTVVFCDHCGYAANIEIAPCPAPQPKSGDEAELAMEKVSTPDAKTIEDVSAFLNVPADKTIKTLFFQADDELICVLVRGDREVNDVKVQRVHPCLALEMAEEDQVAKVVAGGFGSLGPVGLNNVKIYADLEVEQMTNLVCGANEEAYHFINVNPGRDFQVTGYYDLRMMTEEDPCPKCGQKTDSARGIEVGQVFKLGTKYSEALGAKYLDENGKEQVMHMGCYGIGVSRTMAAAVEQWNDENGIVWPKSIAPYHVVIVPISAKDENQMAIAEQLYADLQKRGIEVMLDDRNERPGVKFKDADLIGYPIRITVGKKAVEEQIVEYKLRTEADNEVVALADVVEKTVSYIFE